MLLYPHLLVSYKLADTGFSEGYVLLLYLMVLPESPASEYVLSAQTSVKRQCFPSLSPREFWHRSSPARLIQSRLFHKVKVSLRSCCCILPSARGILCPDNALRLRLCARLVLQSHRQILLRHGNCAPNLWSPVFASVLLGARAPWRYFYLLVCHLRL